MKRLLMTGITLGAFVIPSLCAAFIDFKNLKGEVAPIPAYSWTGIYLGGNVGGKWGKYSESVTTDSTFIAPFLPSLPGQSVSFTTHPGSFTGGIQLGYNKQYRSMLFGVEGDLNAMSLTEKEVLGTTSGDIYVPGDSFRTRSYWQSSLRLRLGLIEQNWLFYVTGGAGLADMKIKADFVQVSTDSVTLPATTGSSSRFMLGGTIGAGVEYALGNHWTLGGEYRYTAYQTKSVHLTSLPTDATLPGPSLLFAPVYARVRLYTNEVLFKANYNFA